MNLCIENPNPQESDQNLSQIPLEIMIVMIERSRIRIACCSRTPQSQLTILIGGCYHLLSFHPALIPTPRLVNLLVWMQLWFDILVLELLTHLQLPKIIYYYRHLLSI